MRWVFIAVALVLSSGTSSAQAQSVDFVYGVAKNFDIPSGSFQNFHVPAIEFQVRDLTLNLARQITFDGEKSETDVTLSYGKQVTERLKVSAQAAYWRYHFPFTYTESRKSDIRWGVEARYRIKR